MNTQKSLWPYGIILTFVLFLSGTAGLVVFACTRPSDLITPNYYEEEIKFQSRIDQLNRTAELSGQVTANYDVTTKTIRVSLPGIQARANTTGHIQLYRPSAVGLDRELRLALDANGVQTLDASTLQPGLWKVRVKWSVAQQDFYAEKSVVVKRGGQNSLQVSKAN